MRGAGPTEMLLKTLPKGAGDLQSIELVRRSPSAFAPKSRSSASASASVASNSAASASEDDLASVGRRKSVSRTSSLSRAGSAARDRKPHDLAHGHLADHPTHVSAAYSPYPHHSPKDHHQHQKHVPSPLAKGRAGPSSQTGSQASSVPRVPSRLSDPATSPPMSGAQSPASGLAALSGASEPPMTNEQLASAFFFRDFPPEARSSSHSPDPNHLGTPAPIASAAGPSAAAVSRTGSGSRERLPEQPSPPVAAPVKVEMPTPMPKYSAPPEQQTVVPPPADQPPMVSPAGSVESLAAVDPAAAAFVLGTGADRGTVPLAPMYGEGELFYPDTGGPLPAEVDGPAQELYPATTNGYIDYRNVPAPTSSSASSEIWEDPRRSTNPALYGYPLEPVSSHSLSSSSGYESAASATGGAASALERLDLDFEVLRAGSPIAAEPVRPRPAPRPPPPARMDSTASSSAASAAPMPGEGEDLQTTDLDGILEWLASSTAAGGLPPPPPSSRGDPQRQDSASSSATTWPSAPPSSYGDSIGGAGAGYGSGAMYGGGWTSYSESDMQQRYSPPVPVSSAGGSANLGAGSSRGPIPGSSSGGGGGGGITWADRTQDSEGEENSAGERISPRKRERNADLEMLRTATITCRDASFSASDSPDHGAIGAGGDGAGEGAGAAWDSTRANSPFGVFDPSGGGDYLSRGVTPRYPRGHAFAAFVGDEFDRFGLGGELDDDWFRQIGIGGGAAGPGLAGLTDAPRAGEEGDIGEDDGYEEDDEASVVGGNSRNPFDIDGLADGFGDGYERSPERRPGLDDDDDDDDGLGWDRDHTFGAGPPALSSLQTSFPLAAESGLAPSQTNPGPPTATANPQPELGLLGDDGFRLGTDATPDVRPVEVPNLQPERADAIPVSPTSPSRLAAYLEQLDELKREEDAHDRGAGWWS